MAMPVQPLSIGVDVAKAELVLCCSSKPVVQTLSNTKAAIRSYFKRRPASPSRPPTPFTSPSSSWRTPPATPST